MTEAKAKPDRILVVILAAVGVLVILALAVVFSRGAPELRDESTPEGVVQRYTAAVIDSDYSAAQAYATERLTGNCESDGYGYGDTGELRVTLTSTTVRDTSATVRVTLVTSYPGGIFGDSEYQEQAEFDLVLFGEQWMIDRAPYQLMLCR